MIRRSSSDESLAGFVGYAGEPAKPQVKDLVNGI